MISDKSLNHVFQTVSEEIKKSKDAIILMLLIPLAEIKAIFYHIDKKVSWYIFSDHERQMCNVVEDYANVVIFGVVFYYLYSKNISERGREVALFLFILNCLDLIHLGLFDMQYLVMAKFMLAYCIYFLWSKLKHFY